MAVSTKAATKKTAASPPKAAPKKAAKAPVKAVTTKAAGKTAPAPASAPRTVARKAAAKPQRASVPREQRHHYVEVAAYYIAERHGFTPGRELADWAAAEAEIDRLLAAGLLNP